MRSLSLALCSLLLLGGCRQAQPKGGAVDADLRALVDTMLPSLARIAALEPRAEVQLARRDSAQVRAFVEQRLEEEMPGPVLDALHRTYALLGVIPDSLDLRDLMVRLYTEQIVGYYDPHERTLYVVEGVQASAVAPVLAHELVHALQDQYVNLDSLIARERGNDPQSAAHAAFEGHATIVMFAYMAEQAAGRRLDPVNLPNPADELAAGMRRQNEQFPVFRDAPAIIRETLLFPYVGGSEFMYRLWQAERLDRPAPLAQWLPQSTEQVLHPRDRFLLQRDTPTALALSPQRGEWQAVGEDNGLGELETGIILEHHLGTDARQAARGWDGDTYRLLRSPRGQYALVWYSVWDDENAARRFARSWRSIPTPAGRSIDVAELSIQGRPGVRVLIRGNGAGAPPELPVVCTGARTCATPAPGD